MARRLNFVIAQPVTIIGFFLAAGLLIADLVALTVSHTYRLPASSPAAPAQHHALTSAFYFGIMAAGIYLIITFLMCFTVFGVVRGHFGRQFNLTAAQRTLMLQTMLFVTYLLLGALIFSHIEGWEFLDAVYWADVTLLTVGLGDFSPSTHTGRSLLIPFAIAGIVTIGLVIGSIRTLVLERGQKKISARMMEKKRLRAINSLDPERKRMRVSIFKSIKFDDVYTNIAQKREQEFKAMRTVQDCAERDRKWMALTMSTTMAFALWLVGALIFYVAERRDQGWSYFEALYFSYACLLTIGYGDLTPISNSGRAFFVLWSLLAVPTLTILISDMGDTVVAAFSKVTLWLGSITVLPDESDFTTAAKLTVKQLYVGKLNPKEFRTKQPPGFLGNKANDTDGDEKGFQQETIEARITNRLTKHFEAEELREAAEAEDQGDPLDRDIHFYHFILARECQRLFKDLGTVPPKRYEWGEWEYFIKLMGNDYDGTFAPGKEMVPRELRVAQDKDEWRRKHERHPWSWLSDKSPLMGHQSEAEWILERLSACLEKEMRDSRLLPGKKPERRNPPISLNEMLQRGRSDSQIQNKGDSQYGTDGDSGPDSNASVSGRDVKMA